MSRYICLIISAATLCMTNPAIADHHESASTESFQQLGKLLVGRWRSDVKFISDWPGEKEGRGAEVHGFAEFSWKADHHLIARVESVGQNSGYWSIYRDPVRKKIRIIIQGTAGGPIEADMWPKSPNTFGWKITGGGQADGKALTGSGEYVFSEDGKKLTMSGTVKLDGKQLDPYKDVYHRLSPPSQK